MSRRPTSNRRLESRAERQARQPGATPPPAARSRQPQRVSAGGSGFLGGLTAGSLGVAAAIAVVVFVLIYAVVQVNQKPGEEGWVKAALDTRTNLPGTYIKPQPGPNGRWQGVEPGADDRQHVPNVIPICSQAAIDADALVEDAYAERPGVANCYNSNPPTSGNHSPNPMPFKVLENPAPKENLVHNMEHGGVIVWYNTTNQELIKQLGDLVTDEINKGHFVAMTLYTEMEPETIALTAWTRLDKFSAAGTLNKDRVKDFISSHDRRFNPEGF